MSDHMTTPNPAELRAAMSSMKAFNDAFSEHDQNQPFDAIHVKIITGQALQIREALHLDEVREYLAKRMLYEGEDCQRFADKRCPESFGENFSYYCPYCATKRIYNLLTK